MFSDAYSDTLSNSKGELYSQVACGDFLSNTHQKPSALIFIGCEKTNDAQLAVLKSTYSVSGKFANNVEKYLIETFAMPKLNFVCCGWETSGGRGSYQYKSYSMSVVMFSTETLIRERKSWSEIPSFIVEVTLFLEEP